jgi:hypothetical protein
MSRKNVEAALKAAIEPERWRKLLQNPKVDVASFERERDATVSRNRAARTYRDWSLPDAAPEPPVCELHGWNPEAPFPGAPRPPASDCPECAAEVEERQSPERPEIVVDPVHGQLSPERLSAAERLWHQRLAAEGKVIPGSPEELAAVEFLNDAREQAIAADRRGRRGSAVWQRYSDDGVVSGRHSARVRRAWSKRSNFRGDEPSWPDIRRRLQIDARQPLFNERGDVIGYAD